jgi:hypothetical protein
VSAAASDATSPSRSRRTMVLPALHLDHEPRARPVGVDQDPLDQDVELRERQRRLADQVEEAGLEVRLGLASDGRVVVEQGGEAAAAVRAVDQLVQGLEIEDPMPFGSLVGAAQLLG